MVNKQRLIESFIRMVETDSVSFQEGKMGELIKSEFAQRGIEVEEDNAAELLQGEVGNLLVRIPGNIDAEPLLFSAHMDTVQPGKNIKAIISDDGFIRSKGDTILGSDDKAAIAAILEAYDIIRENRLDHPPLELLFTICEEQGLLGAKVFDYGKLQAKLGYTLDAGGSPGTIIVQSPCQNEIEYTVYGKAAHAGMNPEDGLNAIKLAAAAISAMPNGRIDNGTTCNFGIIEGGKARNIVADNCVIKGEVRSLEQKKLDELTEKLRNTFQTTVENRGGQAKVDIKFLYPAIKLDPDEPVICLAVKAAEKIGIIPNLVSTGGGSDASIINGNGIRCANLGIGMRDVHTINEHISITDLVDDVRLILAIIEKAGKQKKI